nr:uncharacterized protein LOC105327864 [Crassostrea gigas]
MESRRICAYVYAMKIAYMTILLFTDVPVRSICLEDALSFHSSDKACAFDYNDFNKLYRSDSKKCQIDCSIVSINPNISHEMEKKYEIARMEIYFVSSSYSFVRDKACGNYSNTHFNITIGCAGEYVHDRNIGESCVRDQQCVSFNSTCNEISGMCQCKTGHVYHRNTDSCEPERGLNESCENALQRSVATPNGMCNVITGVCTCAGHMMVVDTRVNDTVGNHNSGVVIGSGVIGLLLGIAFCGALNFIINRLRNQSGLSTRTYISNGEKSVESMNSNPTCNEMSNDEEEGNDIYNHLHEDHIELSVQSDYEYVQQQVTEEDDYSHVTTFNANHIQISGDYGVFS